MGMKCSCSSLLSSCTHGLTVACISLPTKCLVRTRIFCCLVSMYHLLLCSLDQFNRGMLGVEFLEHSIQSCMCVHFHFYFVNLTKMNSAYKQCIKNLTYGKVGRLWV